jgi:hypothetical protein
MKMRMLLTSLLPLGVAGALFAQTPQNPNMTMRRGAGPMMGACPMGPGMGMGGGWMGMGMGPMWLYGGTIDVKNTKNGVTITITAGDAATVSRLQKHAQIMKLLHELNQSDQAGQ